MPRGRKSATGESPVCGYKKRGSCDSRLRADHLPCRHAPGVSRKNRLTRAGPENPLHKSRGFHSRFFAVSASVVAPPQTCQRAASARSFHDRKPIARRRRDRRNSVYDAAVADGPTYVPLSDACAAESGSLNPTQTPGPWPHHGDLRRDKGHHRVRGEAAAFGPPGSVAFVWDLAFVLDRGRPQW